MNERDARPRRIGIAVRRVREALEAEQGGEPSDPQAGGEMPVGRLLVRRNAGLGPARAAARARMALALSVPDDALAAQLIDHLTDLRHLAEAEGADIEAAIRVSQELFADELQAAYAAHGQRRDVYGVGAGGDAAQGAQPHRW